MKIAFFTLMTGLLFFQAACFAVKADNSNDSQPRWQTISGQEAFKLMEESDNFILLDVRTEQEFLEMRIDGAILIPDYEIKERAETELPDKNIIILVYCRSGRRSALSAAVLADLGYINVYDFGGILNWPYGTVSGRN